MKDRILDFTSVKINHDVKKFCNCGTVGYVVDPENRLVTCAGCGVYIDPIEALTRLAEHPEKMNRDIRTFTTERNRILEALWRARKLKPRRIIFKELEKSSYHGRRCRMLPQCPECGKPFYFEKIALWMNEEVWLKWKEAKEAQQ